jgi:hypothetical protein
MAVHVVNVDWLLPLAIWGLTASLLRNGRTLLDRLVLAGVLLIGATSVAGLVMSWWPWGLRPVPVAVAALSALVVIAALLRRRPSLPLGPCRSDLPALGSGLLAATTLALPFLGSDLARRLALMVPGEDIARHFSLYDAIGLIQGYAFVDRHRSDPYLLSGLQTYPQGSHFLYALLDEFRRSGVPAADPIASFSHYLGYHIAGYAFFAVVMLWAVRWVAGPGPTGWQKIAICTLVAAAVSFSPLVTMFIRGYPSEIMGLALFAVLLALLARPPRHTRELIITVAAVVVGIGWVYFFLLPVAGLVTVAALIGYRRRVMAHWLTALVVTVPAVPLALAPYLIMYATPVSPLADLLPGGPVEGVHRGLTVGIATVLLAGLAAAPRSPLRRMVGVQLVIVAGLAVALGIYQIVSIGHLSYYFEKAVHAFFVTCLVGLGSTTPLLAKIGRDSGRVDSHRRPRDLGVAVLVAFGILAGFGAVPLRHPGASGVEPVRNVSWGMAYAAGKLHNSGVGAVIAAVLERYPDPDGRLTQVVLHTGGASYLSTLFVSVLHRDYGMLSREPRSATPLFRDDTRGITIPDFPSPRRIIVINDPELAERIETALETRPGRDVELLSIHVDTTRTL